MGRPQIEKVAICSFAVRFRFKSPRAKPISNFSAGISVCLVGCQIADSFSHLAPVLFVQNSDAGLDTLPEIGDEIVLRSSDVTDVEIEEWKQQGYTIVERSTENEDIVFRFDGTNTTTSTSMARSSLLDTNEDIVPQSVFVEAEDSPSTPESPQTFKGRAGDAPLGK